MEQKKISLRDKARRFLLSWGLQIAFTLWVLFLFVVFSSTERGADAVPADVPRDGVSRADSSVLPPQLIAPNPDTEPLYSSRVGRGGRAPSS